MTNDPFISIQTFYPSLSKVGRKIALYIQNDPNRVISNSIQQMARELSIAESSIVRFCRTIGFSGFSELKIQLVKHTPRVLPSFFEEVHEGDSMEVVAQNVFSRNISTLQTALEQIDFSKIREAAEIIKKAKHIIICGLGASASIAENFYLHLMRVGMNAVASTDAELMQVSARMANRGTVFIAVSRGGRTTAIVKAFTLARSMGAKTISLTAYAKTPLESVSDVCIVHYAPEQVMVSTRVVQNTIIDCLYICSTLHRQDDVITQIAKNREVAAFLYMK